jgi:hypothetical protein
MADVGAIMDALAVQLTSQLAGTASPLIEDLQVESRMVWNPTPPAIDMYPASPFQEQIGMGHGNNEVFITVRARVATPDHEGAQDLLLQMMDPAATTSVAQAITEDETLGGVVEFAGVEPPTEFGAYTDPGGAGALLGCTWRVRVMP